MGFIWLMSGNDFVQNMSEEYPHKSFTNGMNIFVQGQVLMFMHLHRVNLRDVGEVGSSVEWPLSTWVKDHWAGRSRPRWSGCSVGLCLYNNTVRGKYMSNIKPELSTVDDQYHGNKINIHCRICTVISTKIQNVFYI